MDREAFPSHHTSLQASVLRGRPIAFAASPAKQQECRHKQDYGLGTLLTVCRMRETIW